MDLNMELERFGHAGKTVMFSPQVVHLRCEADKSFPGDLT